MALTPEEEAELAELSKDPSVNPALAQAAAQGKSGAVVDQPPTPGSEAGLGGIQAVYGKDWTPYAPGGEPIAQTPEDRGRDDAVNRAEAERVAGMLDPRFSLVPQILALQPATNDPDGDEAAKAKYEAGQKDAIFIYEPPVAVVRKHLIENPSLLRVVSPDKVPSAQEIETLTSDSGLYKTTADYLYSQSEKAATAGGRKIIRYSEAPWAWGDEGVLETLSLKVKGLRPEAANMAQAFILGADDMGAAGIGRATQELTEPTSMLTQPRLGLNESVPQSSREVNAWTEEEYPIPYGLGQGVGALNPRSVFNHLMQGVETGAGWIAKAAMKTRLGGLVADAAPAFVKGAAGMLGDAATGAVGAGAGQVGQEVVDAASRGELPSLSDLSEAGERVVDVGKWGGAAAAAGSGIRRGSGALAENLRWDRMGGDIGATEPNVEYGARSVVLGPRLKPEKRAYVRESRKMDRQPGDRISQEIAPPIKDAADKAVKAEMAAAEAVSLAHYPTEEGQALLAPVKLQEKRIELLRNKHQPRKGEPLDPLGKHKDEISEFQVGVADVSFEPVPGASVLDPDEAELFLSPEKKSQLLKMEKAKAKGAASSAAAASSAPAGQGSTELATTPRARWRDGAPQLEEGHGDPLARVPARAPPRGLRPQLDAARGELSTEVESFPQMKDPRDAPRGAPAAGPRDIDDVAPAARKGARWERRRPPEVSGIPVEPPKAGAPPKPARPTKPGQASKAGKAPVDGEEEGLAASLRRRGIDKVYVIPKSYDAQRHDELISQLQKSADAKTPRAEHYAQLQKAALGDRDARSYQGKVGGWSKVKREHNEKIGKAKRTESAVGDAQAVRTIARTGTSKTGEIDLVDAVEKAAKAAGGNVSGRYDELRALERSLRLQDRALYKGADGQPRGFFNVHNQADAVGIRAFPILRALEGPLGPLRGGSAGRAALMGGGETAAAERRAESGPRAKYEQERAARMKAIDESKAEEKAKRDRRRARREGGGK